MALLEVNGITKLYPGAKRAALSDLSFEINEGEIVTLLGPSGCGKTTTLRLIAGFECPDAGRVSIGGVVAADTQCLLPPEKRGIGMVFQDYALFPHLTVAENIGFPLQKTAGVDIKARVKETVMLVGLQGLEDRFPHQLSGGQQQRVALARALSPKPVLILLDEPFSNLDAELKNHMRQEIKNLIKRAGTTAVFVSHDQRDALAISDKVIVLKDGLLQQAGTPREIYQYPSNQFVASFVGQANIIEGVIGDGTAVQTFLGDIPCMHTHGLQSGEKVLVSIRPESFELDDTGSIEGSLVDFNYVGTTIEAEISVTRHGAEDTILKVHMHPEVHPTAGSKLRFRVLPDFVAVIEG